MTAEWAGDLLGHFHLTHRGAAHQQARIEATKYFVERQRNGDAIKISTGRKNLGGGFSDVAEGYAYLTLGQLSENFLDGDVDRQIAHGLHSHAVAQFVGEAIQNRLQRQGNARSDSGTLDINILTYGGGSRSGRHRCGRTGRISDFHRRGHQRRRDFRSEAAVAGLGDRAGFVSTPEQTFEITKDSRPDAIGR